MTQIKEVKKQAKERGFKGYSTLCKKDLIRLLDGKPILRRKQIIIEKQRNFSICDDCYIKRYVNSLKFVCHDDKKRIAKNINVQIENQFFLKMYQDAKEKRNITYDGDLEFDIETGELLGHKIDYSRC